MILLLHRLLRTSAVLTMLVGIVLVVVAAVSVDTLGVQVLTGVFGGAVLLAGAQGLRRADRSVQRLLLLGEHARLRS